MTPYDIIGDIHGHADELHSLLRKLGYQNQNGTFSHAEGRKVIFLGDFIDRGPKIRTVLETVRGMLDAGQALAILGNHEINALRFHSKGRTKRYLRPRNRKNTHQHRATLKQFRDKAEWTEWLQWFAGLPLSLDLGGLRAVHACWDDEVLQEMNEVGRLEGTTLEEYSRKKSKGYERISRILNGPEALLPEGETHKTADGNPSPDIRVKWWLNLEGLSSREAIFPDNPGITEKLPLNVPKTGYSTEAPPTFFGHYALKDHTPSPIRGNLACLDYGMGKGGSLCAYRWDGETVIDPEKFLTTPQGPRSEE